MKKSNVIQRFIFTIAHSIFLIICITLLILPIYIYSRIKCLIKKDAELFKEFSLSSKIILFGLGVDYRCDEELPEGSYIVGANHESMIDVFLISAFYNGRKGIVFVNNYLFRIPILGFFMRKIKAISVTVEKYENGLVKNSKIDPEDLKKLTKLLKSGYDAFIFPEGTRTIDGQLLPFQDGASVISMRSGKKIIPIGITGGYEFYNKKSWMFNPAALPIAMKIGEPIDYAGTSGKALTVLIKEKIEICIKNAKELRERSMLVNGWPMC